MQDFETQQEREQAARDTVLEASLAHVPFEGWGGRAIDLGAREAGMTAEDVQRLFPAGARDMVRHWSVRSDARMLEQTDAETLATMRVRARIQTLIMARLRVNTPHREALRRTLAWLSLPFHLSLGSENVLRTVNAMWYAAGDTATDWNWYSKRVLLVPVYTSAVLYWLGDEEDEDGTYANTQGYVERRIEDVLKVFGLPKRVLAGGLCARKSA